MDARRIRAALIAAVAVALMGANYRTANFVVTTSDARLAEAFAKTSEKLRRSLAVEWLGQEMPDWYQPCIMNVQVGPHLGAGGATSFLFDRGEVYGWQMDIQGSAERVLDSVLPHEITHMVFASYFRAPLPRWADEGGATSVECPSEQARHREALVKFLRTNRGIAFSDMFAMTQYPADVMPLYAQAHSLANYLIQQGGRRKYVSFLADGMQGRDWPAALDKWYGVKDLGTLQNTWVAWVGRGCPPLAPQAPATPEAAEPTALASARPPRPAPNLVYQVGPAASARPLADGMVPVVAEAASTATVEPRRTQLTRPQPFQRPEQSAPAPRR